MSKIQSKILNIKTELKTGDKFAILPNLGVGLSSVVRAILELRILNFITI